MKALITGAGGFIGSHLVEGAVREGLGVRALVHYNARNDWGWLETVPREILDDVEVVAGDVRDPFMVDTAVRQCEVVFHLASLIAIPYSYVAPQSYVETNVLGAVNVMQACLRHNVQRVVHTSTSECYGTARHVPIGEAHPLQGQSPYSASKIGADMIVESFWRSFELPVATIRPFNTYGPRQSARAVIPTIISQALAGDRVKLGSLSPTRDLTFVADTVDGFLRMARTPDVTGQTINVGSGREISIGDLANLILRLTGRGDEVAVETESQRVRPDKSEVERLLCDNRRAADLLGWSPRVSLEQGLGRTIEWMRSNLDRYKTELYNV